MKTKITIIALMLVTSLSAQKITKIKGLDSTRHLQNGAIYKSASNRMEIEGVYNGKDLFIKNPFGRGGVGFCVTQVKVNGDVTTDEINAPMFKINLELFKLKPNDKLKILIYYQDSCSRTEPLIMNPGAVSSPKLDYSKVDFFN